MQSLPGRGSAAVNDAPRRLTITIRPADYEALVQFAAAAERDEKLYHSEQVKEARLPRPSPPVAYSLTSFTQGEP